MTRQRGAKFEQDIVFDMPCVLLTVFFCKSLFSRTRWHCLRRRPYTNRQWNKLAFLLKHLQDLFSRPFWRVICQPDDCQGLCSCLLLLLLLLASSSECLFSFHFEKGLRATYLRTMHKTWTTFCELGNHFVLLLLFVALASLFCPNFQVSLGRVGVPFNKYTFNDVQKVATWKLWFMPDMIWDADIVQVWLASFLFIIS